MNIVLYSHTFLPTIGGREIVMFQLAKALATRGHRVRILGPQGFRSARSESFGIQVCRYPRITSGKPFTDRLEQRLAESQMIFQLGLDLAFRGADVIHAHVLYPAGYVASVLKAHLCNKPLVVTPHGVDINTAPDRNYGMRLNPDLRRKIDAALRRADAVTAISEGVFAELCGAGVEKSRIHRIGNGIDVDRFSGLPGCDARQLLGIPRASRLILTVGNYTPLKGHEDLIRVLPAILEREPSAHLVIVGACTEHLRRVAETCGVSARVILPGIIPLPNPALVGSGMPDLLADIYKASAVYVSSSNREGAEGLSLALLDAMAASLPLVGTDIVGNRDVIQSSKNGYLVPLGDPQAMIDAVCGILGNPDLTHCMSIASRVAAEAFDWTKVAMQYESVYGDALATSGRSKLR